MNDLLLAQEVVAILTGGGYSDLADALKPRVNPIDANQPPFPNIFAAQDSAYTSRPILVITGEYNNYGNNRLGTLTLELRGRTGDESQRQHQQAFELLWTAFLGAKGSNAAETTANQIAAKTVLIAALAARNNLVLLDYGPSNENTLVADVDGDDLRTTLRLRVAWSFAPVS